MYKKIIVVLLLSALALPVYAETSAVKERGQKNVSEANCVTGSTSTFCRGLNKASSSTRDFLGGKGPFRGKMASTSEEWLQKRKEMRERMSERREMIRQKISEKMGLSYEKLFENMTRMTENLTKHSVTVGDRISDLEKKGFDLTNAKAELSNAEKLIGKLPELLDEKADNVKNLLSAENPRENKASIKAEITEAKNALKEARAALVQAIVLIRNTGGNDSASTTPENN